MLEGRWDEISMSANLNWRKERENEREEKVVKVVWAALWGIGVDWEIIKVESQDIKSSFMRQKATTTEIVSMYKEGKQ